MFKAFFNYPEMKEIADNFSVYHLNAPGNEKQDDRIEQPTNKKTLL